MAQLGFFIDATQCSGCKTCQIACKDKNNLPVGTLFREVLDFEGGVFPYVWAASLSLACNHCTAPQCVPNCPVAAITKDEDVGLVLQDRTMCIGCERCVDMCPYHAPAYMPDKMIVGKCDGCFDLVAKGQAPACVAACSTRALQFGELRELRSRFGDPALTGDVEGLPSSSLTTPSLLIKARKEMLP
ncbi:MAG: 4Fe-4S binding protein [Coriobacteriales bacterium]|jgi:anaerobic dimethyl sulfoxide reductase subunit B (iron-sulfur subunit)|nr:4Fe-4S binding protein [Coriobacteriales bacterium]